MRPGVRALNKQTPPEGPVDRGLQGMVIGAQPAVQPIGRSGAPEFAKERTPHVASVDRSGIQVFISHLPDGLCPHITHIDKEFLRQFALQKQIPGLDITARERSLKRCSHQCRRRQGSAALAQVGCVQRRNPHGIQSSERLKHVRSHKFLGYHNGVEATQRARKIDRIPADSVTAPDHGIMVQLISDPHARGEVLFGPLDSEIFRQTTQTAEEYLHRS